MSIIDRILRRDELQEARTEIEELRTDIAIRESNVDLFTERLAELELQLEDQGWQVLTGATNREFSRQGLRIINGLARIYFLKNPLIKRAVLTQTQYVFGRGVNVSAKHPLVNDVIQAFWDDPKNKTELTSHQSLQTKETELQCFANVFFIFFTNKYNGHVRIRTIPMDEITEIITNPEDAKEPWFYHRQWSNSTSFNSNTGMAPATVQDAYYPDWNYKPKGAKPSTINGYPVHWDNPIYHIAVNKLSDMQYGVSEIYAALDWSRAYKEFLENWATIVKAHARFAWKLSTPGGSTGVAAAKAKLATTINSTGTTEGNPPPATGSTFIGNDGIKLEPTRTGGAQTKSTDSHPLRQMVSSATGIFEHYLTGDPSTGNLATAKAMELPMLIMFEDRQTLWASVLSAIIKNKIILEAVRAGKLPGKIIVNDQGEEIYLLANDIDNEDPDKAKEPIDDTVDVDFRPILQKRDETIEAIVSAATLDGKASAGTLDAKLVTRLLLTALGLDDIDAIIDEMYPPETDAEPGTNPEDEESVDTSLNNAFREAIIRINNKIDEGLNEL